MFKRKKILIVAPHMDDETLGAGGAICYHIDKGDEVNVVIVANRSYNHVYDRKKIKNEERCCRLALRILGVNTVNFLGLRDEELDGKIIDIIKPLEILAKKIRPDMVYMPYIGDVNQDHKATYRACMVVFRITAKFSPKIILCYEVPSSTDANQVYHLEVFNPNYFINIEKYLNKKIDALKAYKSELREFPHPRSEKGLRVYASKRGMEASCKYAEAFMLIRYFN